MNLSPQRAKYQYISLLCEDFIGIFQYIIQSLLFNESFVSLSLSFVFVYLFGCTRSYLQLSKSSVIIVACRFLFLWHVISSSLARDQTQAPALGLASGSQEVPRQLCFLLMQGTMFVSLSLITMATGKL